MRSLNRSISSLPSIETLSKPFSDAKSKKVLDERLDVGKIYIPVLRRLQYSLFPDAMFGLLWMFLCWK